MNVALAVSVLADNGHMDFDGGWAVVIVVAMVLMMGGMGWMMLSMMRSDHGNANTSEGPVEILKRRYASGELTTEEFQERLRVIEDSRG